MTKNQRKAIYEIIKIIDKYNLTNEEILAILFAMIGDTIIVSIHKVPEDRQKYIDGLQESIDYIIKQI